MSKSDKPVSNFLGKYLTRLGNFALDPIGTLTGGPSVDQQAKEIREKYTRIKEFTPEFKNKKLQEQKQKELAKLEKEKQRKLEEAAFEGKLKNLREGKNLDLDPNLKEKEVEYGPKKRAVDLLERYVNNQVNQNQLLGYSQNLLNQEVSALSEANRQRLETNLAFDRDSPTRQQERQLKAKYGEALLAEAVAKQATAGAAIGGLQSQTKFGSGRVN